MLSRILIKIVKDPGQKPNDSKKFNARFFKDRIFKDLSTGLAKIYKDVGGFVQI